MARKLFTNARVVTRREVFLGTIELHADRIVRVDIGATSLPGAEDFDGDLLVPGLVDLPVPGRRRARAGPACPATWAPPEIVASDLAAAMSGVTTTVDVASIRGSDEDEEATRTGLQTIAARLAELRTLGLLRTDHFIRLHCPDTRSACLPEHLLASLHAEAAPRLVVLDPSPSRAEGSPSGPVTFAHARDSAIPAVYTSAGGRPRSTASRCPWAVLDPGTRGSAAASRDSGGFVVLTAGRVTDLAVDDTREPARGRLIVGSAGVPARLLAAALLLGRRWDSPLPEVIATVTENPARFLGLADRGAIEVGRRADFVRLRMRDAGRDTLAVPVATWRAGARVA